MNPQKLALLAAFLYGHSVVTNLPDTMSLRWSMNITDDDSVTSPAALNIFVRTEDDRVTLRKLLKETPVTEGQDYESYAPVGALQVSILET